MDSSSRRVEHDKATEPTDATWCQHHFDHASPALAQHLHETMALMRAQCPVTRTDQHGGYWVVTDYDDVVEVAQNWRRFHASDGITVPRQESVLPVLPLMSDPPVQQIYKRLINPYFTPAAVREHEARSRQLVTRLIDGFVEDGRCEFMEQFAFPFPGMLFFEAFLGTPPDEAAKVNQLTMAIANPNHPDTEEVWREMMAWLVEFVERRRREPAHDDVVDAVLGAEIDGRPITEQEIFGIILLLILGGLDTTAGALGQFVIRFTQQPEIPERLRREPELIDAVVEELLRLDGSVFAMGRTATDDIELAGHQIKAGEAVLFYLASANRDAAEFEDPGEFRLDRESNRHLAFGIGTHRCAGSNLARMNLRIAVTEIVDRLGDLRLRVDPSAIHYHSLNNRAPLAVPITFTPGPRLAS